MFPEIVLPPETLLEAPVTSAAQEVPSATSAGKSDISPVTARVEHQPRVVVMEEEVASVDTVAEETEARLATPVVDSVRDSDESTIQTPSPY